MRRITTAITAAALSVSMALSLNLGTTQAATPGYDSAYQFESAFLTLKPADSGTFSVFFANTGTTSWIAGGGTQVNLAVCAADKVTCNVGSAQAAWASGWLSSTAYATHTKSVVAPGDFSAFTYNIKVPTGQAGGVYRFNGDLVVGATGDRIHPEGYYQDSNVTGAGGGGSALSITPDYPANEDNEVSTTVPGNGQHTYTISTTLTGTLTLATITSGNSVRNSDGTFGFCDTGQDKKADGVGGANSQITAINGSSISPSNVVINQPIPSNGTMTVTVDSSVRNTRTRLIAWQDKNNNAQVDLTAAGDVNCDNFTPYDATTDGVLALSGRKFWFGPQGQFGAQDTGCPGLFVYRHDSTNQVFSAGTTIATSLRYAYDANDVFKVLGTQVTLATFKSELTASNSDSTHADQVDIAYDPNSAGISTFNICVNKGADAPTDVSAAVGNFDNGSAAEDVRLQFTSPAVNSVLSFNVQRATKAADGSLVVAATCTPGTSPNPNGSGTTPPSDGTAGNPPTANFSTVGATSTPGTSETATFTNFDLSPVTAPAGYCYRVQVTNPNTGANSYSNYVFVQVTTGTAGDTTPPTSTEAKLTTSGGFANTLDQGDKIQFFFSDTPGASPGCGATCGMSIAPNATIRVTDSDCGAATESGPATCSGGNTNTVADIICGTNATCTTNTFGSQTNNQLIVTMTSGPSIISAGSTAGSQYPVVVTDSSGITDLSGNTWDLTTSGATGDRVFGPQGF